MKRVKLKMSKKFSVNKPKIAIIALILTLTISAVLVALPITTAQFDFPEQPPLQINIPTFLYATVAPNPVGVNQIVYLHAVFSKPTPTFNGRGGDLYENVTIEIVAPDGSKDILGPYTAGMTGGVATSFTPTKVGEYTIKAVYLGQILTGTNPDNPEPTGWNLHLLGSLLMPCISEEVTLVVQEDQVTSLYQTPALPEEYWTRPIYATNWDWGLLGGSWFGLAAPGFATTGRYDATGNFQPYSTAPNTPHIMWTKPTHFGGQAGLPISSDQASQYTSTSVLIRYFEPIILNGILYYTRYASINSEIVGWEAVDIRTGETLWSREAGITGNEAIKMGQILRFHNIQEYGSTAFLWSTPMSSMFGGAAFFGLYDAMTGEFVANITNPASAAFIMDFEAEQQGTILGYYTSGGNLTMWNSTKIMGGSGMDAILLRPSGTLNFADGVEWSVPIPTELDGVEISLSRAAVTPEVILLRQVPNAITWQEANLGYQITAGVDAKTGELLWGPINQTLPRLQDVGLLAARDGVYVLHNKDANEAYGYSLVNGTRLWGPVKLEGNAWSAMGRGAEIAYGKVYIFDSGGYVHAINLESGEVEWNFTRGSAGYDTPFGVYPLFHYGMHSVADGKLFLSEGFLYTPPLHPSRRVAIDCDSGNLVWSILSYSSRCPAAIADGYLIQWNSFDNQIYSFGKGPTETTVKAPDVGIPVESTALISGTVMDISAGSEQEGVIERFPNGLPAVADEDMKEWMEYVYMQQECPTDLTGVPVKIEVVDPNNEYHNYGTYTTDAYGNYALPFEPDVEGTYLIMATFEGSESYWRSQSATYLTASPAPEVETGTDYTPMFIAIILAVIIAILIGLVNLLALRKRK
jgi:hypothetical protein